MFQVVIVMVENGFMVQVPPPQQAGGPPQMAKTLVFPDLDSAINYAKDIFGQIAEAQTQAVSKQADLLAAAQAETEAAVEETEKD